MNAPKAPPPDVPALRRRLQIALIAALFLGPLALSFWAYYGAVLRPAGRTHHGQLVDPARPLPEVPLATSGGASSVRTLLTGRWSLVYVAAAGCDAGCREVLDETRSIRAALGADATRVRRVLIALAPCCELATLQAAGAEVAVAFVEGEDANRLLAVFPEYGAPVASAERLYVVDPLGNLMMSYAAGAAPSGVIKDLERLLKLSHIG
jgi:cytochrome oxidase Cu insertion factor (SCO1/SenC/PrrC family)